MEGILAGIKLTVAEYAKLRGCSERYVQSLCQKERIKYEEVSIKSRGGTSGISYLIPLASLPDKEIKRYIRIHSKEELLAKGKPIEEPEENKIIDLTYETLSADQREELGLKKRILDSWHKYRLEEKSKGVSLAEADDTYIRIVHLHYPDMKFSRATLNKWNKAMADSGEMALIDMRGRHNNHKSVMTDEVFDIFQFYYLDENRKSVSYCVTLTKLEAKKRGIDTKIPGERTFVNWISKIPEPVLIYCRYGAKALKDKAIPYIHRFYDDIRANDMWVSDNHTFDIMITDGEKPMRVYLTAFMDIRSRKIVGHYVTTAPSADATLYALRKGIERYGIPKEILTDNGREFLTFDIGGRGFRKKGSEQDPETIMERLGIEFHTAMVKNARAKIIERTFRTVKEEFSRLFLSYTGGNVIEKPERLKEVVKDVGNLMELEEFREKVNTYIEKVYNLRENNGYGMRGRSPNEVYKATLVEVRKASKEVLDIMLLRSTRLQKVTRAGVKLKFYDKEIFFISDELILNHQGEQAFVRYNPEDLSEVRVYDSEDRYILTAKQVEGLSYFATKEKVSEAMKEQRRLTGLVKAYKKDKNLKGTDALDLVLEAASEVLDENGKLSPEIIKVLRNPDKESCESIATAVGAEELDWGKANEKIKKLERK